MCLNSNYRHYDYLKKRFTASVAGYDILVWKWLKKKSDLCYVSPYYDQQYDFGKTYSVKFDNYDVSEGHIGRGLHSFIDMNSARTASSTFSSSRFFPAIIPKGTRFITGSANIVSEKLIVYRNMEDLMKGRYSIKPDWSAHYCEE